jgi:hypothetical protein
MRPVENGLARCIYRDVRAPRTNIVAESFFRWELAVDFRGKNRVWLSKHLWKAEKMLVAHSRSFRLERIVGWTPHQQDRAERQDLLHMRQGILLRKTAKMSTGEDHLTAQDRVTEWRRQSFQSVRKI